MMMGKSKEFAQKLFYKGLYKWGLAFSKETAFKYGKLIMCIANMEDDIKIIDKDESIIKLQTINYKGNPVMEWEIYRDVDKDAYAHKFVKVTCKYLTGDFTVPVTKSFGYDTDQMIIFNVMIQHLNTIKMEMINKKGGY